MERLICFGREHGRNVGVFRGPFGGCLAPLDPRAPKATIVPISQGGDGRAGGDLVINGEGVDEVYSMGYTYTTTVTDARVQAISGKHKSLLAKKIPDKKK